MQLKFFPEHAALNQSRNFLQAGRKVMSSYLGAGKVFFSPVKSLLKSLVFSLNLTDVRDEEM